MAAFLDPNGLNLFYGLIAAKFGAGAATGSMDYSKATLYWRWKNHNCRSA